jgi:membrane fusion protein, copper/silver efflux system
MRKQVIVSVAMVALAAGSVAVYALTGGSADEENSAAGHNHGSMAASDSAVPVRLDAEHARRIGITYAVAEAGPMSSVVRTVGAVTYDETKLVSVNPKIEGWVEKLYADFTGAPVTKGQPLMAIYSPMLVSAQEELILARRLLDNANPGGSAARNAQELLDASRRRLSYWDIPASDITRIERSGTPQKTIVLRAPASGLVVEKAVFQGQRIMPGMDLYRIADLSTVWLEAEVFEKDLGLVNLGRKARIKFEAYPGEVFAGTVAYVYPTITADSRTGRVRVELANPTLRFKPGMYASMEFDVPVHTGGIHVPRSAVLETGERTIVFVQNADGSLAPRPVRVGMATTEHVEVLAGLRAGEVVVASANFLVDAESNLAASLGAMQDVKTDAAAAQPKAGADPHAGHNTSAPAVRK